MMLPEMYSLDVGEGNKIHVEVSGKKGGVPIIFLHGGPGGHCRSEHHCLFDPEIFQSVIFDQRGCGKSTPYRSLNGNDTEHLINDIEQIRRFLNFEKFIIVGGSWGATLALKYSLKYPDNVLGILLRSVFLGTMKEIEWAFIDGPKIFAPNLYDFFSSLSKPKTSLIESYYEEVCENESKLHSWVWHDYERILSQINPQYYEFEDENKIMSREGLPNSPYMELHYIKNNFFMEEDYIVNKISEISHIPGFIVQGRYDLICPPSNAYKLHKNWESSNLIIVNTAGHSSSDEGIMDNMLECLKKLVNHI